MGTLPLSAPQAADEAMYQAVRGNLLGLPEQPDSWCECLPGLPSWPAGHKQQWRGADTYHSPPGAPQLPL